jgi:hypothetical protein
VDRFEAWGFSSLDDFLCFQGHRSVLFIICYPFNEGRRLKICGLWVCPLIHINYIIFKAYSKNTERAMGAL